MRNKNDKLSTAKINLWNESFITSISTIIGFFISIITVIVITRFLSMNDVGFYFFYLALIYLGIQIPKGIGTALKKRVSSTDDEIEWKKYLTISILLTFFTLIIMSILSLSLFYIDKYIAINITILGILSVNFTMYCYSVLKISMNYLSGIGEPGKSSEIKNYVGNGLKILFISIGLYIYPTYYVALTMYGFAYLIAGIICLYVSIDSKKIEKPELSYIKEIYVFAKWSIPNTFLNDIYNRLDTILLGIFIGALSVSYYDVSQRLGYLASFIGVGVSNASNIKISGMYESNIDVTDITSKSISASTLFAYPFLIIIILYSEFIIGFVFGSSYIGAKYFLIGLVMQQVIKCYSMTHESILNALDVPKKIILPSITALISNIITAIPLIFYFGGIGVVISTFLSEIFRVIYLQYNLKSELNDLTIHKSIFTQAGVFITLLTIFYIINSVITINSIITVSMISIVIILLFYFIMYMLSSLFREIINDIQITN